MITTSVMKELTLEFASKHFREWEDLLVAWINKISLSKWKTSEWGFMHWNGIDVPWKGEWKSGYQHNKNFGKLWNFFETTNCFSTNGWKFQIFFSEKLKCEVTTFIQSWRMILLPCLQLFYPTSSAFLWNVPKKFFYRTSQEYCFYYILKDTINAYFC